MPRLHGRPAAGRRRATAFCQDAGFRQSSRQEEAPVTTQPVQPAMTPLRRRMLEDMKLRNMATSTRKIYVAAVAGFSAYHGRSPDQLTFEDVRDYQLHLIARGLKASSICPVMSALRFFYGTTLGHREAVAQIPFPRKA